MIRNKRTAWKKYITKQSQEARNEYSKARNKVRNETRKFIKKHEREIAKGAKSNPKKFWSYINSKRKTPVGIAELSDSSGHVYKTDNEKANALKDFFNLSS